MTVVTSGLATAEGSENNGCPDPIKTEDRDHGCDNFGKLAEETHVS